MPITALDPKTALLVIDLQKSIAEHPLLTPLATIVERANTLTEAFRRHDLPVVMVVVANAHFGRTDTSRPRPPLPADATDLLPDLVVAAGDHRVTKRTVGAFTSTDLEARLRKADVTNVVVIGVATSFGVESTVRHAAELGFNVTVVTDAVTDVSAENHARAIAGIFPRMAETGTTQELVDMLDQQNA